MWNSDYDSNINEKLKYYFDEGINDVNYEAKLFDKSCKSLYDLFKLGNTYYTYKAYEKAFSIFSYLIHTQDLNESYKEIVYNGMGYMYENGFGVETSCENAIIMYKNAKNYMSIMGMKIYDEKLKKYANGIINSLKDEKETISKVKAYVEEKKNETQRQYYGFFIINSCDYKKNIDSIRDISYEKKIIEHIKKMGNKTAANILNDFYSSINDIEFKQTMTELLALWGDSNSSYETFLNYQYKDYKKAKKFLKLYLQQILKKVDYYTEYDIKHKSFHEANYDCSVGKCPMTN
jgi:hypothetical protein